jgi:protoheme ferro-lyase
MKVIHIWHTSLSVRLVMSIHYSTSSRSNPEPPSEMAEPSTDAEKARWKWCQEFVGYPVFVSDHIGTAQYIEYSKAWELGIAKFARMPSLNSSPFFIEALAKMVRTANAD